MVKIMFKIPESASRSGSQTRFNQLLLITSDAHLSWIRGSGSVRSSHQTVSGASNNSCTFHFWHKSLILEHVKLAELFNDISNERMWHFIGGGGGYKHTLTPPTYFRGSNPHLHGHTSNISKIFNTFVDKFLSCLADRLTDRHANI